MVLVATRTTKFCWTVLLLMMTLATRNGQAFVAKTSSFPKAVRAGRRAKHSLASVSTSESPSSSQAKQQKQQQQNQDREKVPLYRSEGLFAVYKPLEWTSQDVVSFVRKMLEREARDRGANPAKLGRKNKSRQIKVGHGGTLDPLATGVLVLGVGKGTKELQRYLTGSKAYVAEGQFGTETTTLDMDPKANVTKEAPYDHITADSIKAILPQFTGTIQQIPPLYSAIRKDGKRLYDQARKGGVKEGDIQIEPRQVEIHQLKFMEYNKDANKFKINVECGGGTYIRSLIRDMAHAVDSVATMTALERTKQGQFTLEHCLKREDWSPNNIYHAIDQCNQQRAKEEQVK